MFAYEKQVVKTCLQYKVVYYIAIYHSGGCKTMVDNISYSL